MAGPTMIGLVRYADDPVGRYFRRVIPTASDRELDDPQWLSLGLDPGRTAVMDRFPADSPEAAAPLNGTPWTPADEPLEQPPLGYVAPPALVTAILDLAQVKAGDVLFDLGSGDGPILIAAAERGARAIGIEQDARRVARSLELASMAGVVIEVRTGDYLGADLSEASVVVFNCGTADLPPLTGIRSGTRIVVVDADEIPRLIIAS